LSRVAEDMPAAIDSAQARPPARRLAGIDPVSAGLVAAGFAALYLPMFWDWFSGRWVGETQGHEAVFLAISGWLIYRRLPELVALDTAAAKRTAAVVVLAGLLCFLLGYTQEVVRLELLSLILNVAGALLLFKGPAALRVAWFPLFFMLFALPLPYTLVLTLTAPLKTAVSIVAVQLLDWIGYPMGRSGVVITIGQYQLLVTEACAGLQTMFTLEAMGLLYASLMNHASPLRNTLLAILVVPVAFAANVVRVVLLSLVTYHYGNAAGQGFLHGFAGLVLFAVGLVLMMLTDALLGWALRTRRESKP
jgi:exosortase B